MPIERKWGINHKNASYYFKLLINNKTIHSQGGKPPVLDEANLLNIKAKLGESKYSKTSEDFISSNYLLTKQSTMQLKPINLYLQLESHPSRLK
jgi:hypothetical protein